MSTTAVRPRPSRAEHKQLTREQIRRAAISLFESPGFSATTIDEIAAEAGVGRRTFFRYFSCKEAVLFSDAVLRDLPADLDAALTAGVPPMRALIEAIAKDSYGTEAPDALTVRRRRLRVALLSEPSVMAFYQSQIGAMAQSIADVVRRHPQYAAIRFLPELIGGVMQTLTSEHLLSGETHHFTADATTWRRAIDAVAASFAETWQPPPARPEAEEA